MLTCLRPLLLFDFQAFQETISIFQQKNESFKSALKDVEEVSVGVASNTLAPVNCWHRGDERVFVLM